MAIRRPEATRKIEGLRPERVVDVFRSIFGYVNRVGAVILKEVGRRGGIVNNPIERGTLSSQVKGSARSIHEASGDQQAGRFGTFFDDNRLIKAFLCNGNGQSISDR